MKSNVEEYDFVTTEVAVWELGSRRQGFCEAKDCSTCKTALHSTSPIAGFLSFLSILVNLFLFYYHYIAGQFSFAGRRDTCTVRRKSLAPQLACVRDDETRYPEME